MTTKFGYEEDLLKEIRDLSESDLLKMIKAIHFFKEEIFRKEEVVKGNITDILELAGAWRDMPDAQLAIFAGILKERESFSKGRVGFV
ncbi:MAG TPA: hypothetical protein ENI60_01530 [Candidatus Fraserbacteria bacterium]|nr:hypothetical protein [Candidatus Fraserbacteria bacterium]